MSGGNGKGHIQRGDKEARRRYEEGWERIFNRGKDWRKVLKTLAKQRKKR